MVNNINRLDKVIQQKELTKSQYLVVYDATNHPILSNMPDDVLAECEEKHNCVFVTKFENMVGLPGLQDKGKRLIITKPDSLQYLKDVIEYQSSNMKFNVKIVNFQEDHKVGMSAHLLFIPKKDKVLHYMMSNINMTASYNWDFLQDFLKSNQVFLMRDDTVAKDNLWFTSKRYSNIIPGDDEMINDHVMDGGYGIVTVSNKEVLKGLVNLSFNKNIILKNVELW